MAYHRRKTWNDCKDEKIITIYKEVFAEAKKLYPEYFNISPPLYIDSSTKFLGHCVGEIDRATIRNKFGFQNHFGNLRWKNAAIIISKYITTDLNVVRACIIHEMGHFVTPYENHSYCWEMRANNIGKKWNISCSRLADKKESAIFAANIEKAPHKDYQVVCEGCGLVIHRKKMCDIIKNPQRWKCGECGAHFKKK